MGNVGAFALSLLNAEGDPASEPHCTVDFVSVDGTSVLHAPGIHFPPTQFFRASIPTGKKPALLDRTFTLPMDTNGLLHFEGWRYNRRVDRCLQGIRTSGSTVQNLEIASGAVLRP